MSVAGKT